MVGGELHDEEVRSLRDLVEEAAQLVPRKSKKKKYGGMRWAQAKQRPMRRLLPMLNKGKEWTK